MVDVSVRVAAVHVTVLSDDQTLLRLDTHTLAIDVLKHSNDTLGLNFTAQTMQLCEMGLVNNCAARAPFDTLLQIDQSSHNTAQDDATASAPDTVSPSRATGWCAR